MVSKKPAKAPKPHHSAHLSSKVSATSSAILFSSFSPSHLRLSLFASTVLGLDAQRLRIHDTTTGRLRCEHVFDKGAVCNSIAWSILPAVDLKDDGKTKKKKRKRTSTAIGDSAEHNGTAVLALGMNKGNILLYSPTEGTLVGSLDAAHTGEVTSFKFSDSPGRGWSCGTDGKLVEWDLRRKTILRIVSLPDPSIRTLALAPPTVLCASHTVYSINPDIQGSIPKFAANATPIHDLIVSSDSSHPHFLTSAEADRYINVFFLTQQKQVGALVAESDVKHLSTNFEHGCEGLEVLAAVTADGMVELFSHPWQPAPAAASSSPTVSRKAKAMTRKSDTKIQVIRPKTKATVPIINASFQTGGELVFAWVESGVNIEFDRIRWQNAEDGSLALHGLVEVTKTKSLGLGGGIAGNAVQMNGAKDMGKSHVDQARTVVISGVDTQDMGMIDAADASDVVDEESDNANESEDETSKHAPEEPSFADKFQTLEVSAANNNSAANISKAFATPPAGNKAIKPFSGSLTTVLTQALRTDDAQLLESCLLTTDSKAILNTIRRLDSTYAVTLIEKLSDRIARRPGRAATLSVWVRWTIVAHGGYLLSLPNLMMTLAGLHSTLATRAGALPKLLQLQGRLDMLNAQLELRNSLRRGVGETGVDLAEEEEQIEEGVLYIEGKTKDDNDDSEDENGGSDEEPEEVGMEGLQIEDASFIQGKLDASDDEDGEEEEEEEEEERGSAEEGDEEGDEDEEANLNDVVSEDEDEEEDQDMDGNVDGDGDEDDEVVERYGGLIDDEAEESDGEDFQEISEEEPVTPVKPVVVKKKTPEGKKR
ncbi:NUC189-domain-containing protein [Terfezia boudieri ATCC MYA-4762]|uniref:NUC189-domain-containing protein n=1 Tax=Terfezia boudieri ATCC MYA-4762 TaxID=1051890 RepID=A0A3N4M2E0_9PEZI|nr:NUC189-domain-containing protein [Terfezia boudieri ATCC MYA-4762]